jgi:hypothetical protein
MKTLKSFFLIVVMVIIAKTSLFAWTSSNEGVCYTMDTLTTLSPNITYNSSTGMYEVHDNINILENDTLKILPGEILKFINPSYPYYGIKIYGCLIAIGSKDSPITLGDPEYNISNGFIWCGIQFFNTSQNGESKIIYCSIIGAINACSEWSDSESAIYCENSSPIFSHCVFSYMLSDFEYGGGSAISCKGQSYPLLSYCKFENLYNSIAVWCNPFEWDPDTISKPSPLMIGCNIMPSVTGFCFGLAYYDVIIFRGGFLDNCYLGVNTTTTDTTLGTPMDTIGDGICNTTSTFWKKRFMDVDGVVNPRGDTLITGINETEIEILPTTTNYQVLKNCFPNPFHDFTTIEFVLTEPSQKVSLIVLDSKGNRVKTLLNEEILPPGELQVKWYGDNDSGIKVKEGIYFYKLTCNNKMLVKKAIVIK